MEKYYEQMLDAIANVVSRMNKPYGEVKQDIIAYAKQEGYDGDLEEFLSWFDEEPE